MECRLAGAAAQWILSRCGPILICGLIRKDRYYSHEFGSMHRLRFLFRCNDLFSPTEHGTSNVDSVQRIQSVSAGFLMRQFQERYTGGYGPIAQTKELIIELNLGIVLV